MQRLLIVQYAGDFREVHHRLATTGAESYYAHRYVLETMSAIARDRGAAGLLCARTQTRYEEILPNGVTVIGAAADPYRDWRQVADCIRRFSPTHLVLHGPMSRLIGWATRQPFRTACLFADSFEMGRARRWLRYGALPSLLRRPQVEWIANHGINACRSVERLGVPGSRILPWDMPHDRSPLEHGVRAGPGQPPHSLLYVGSLVRAKGVGDVIEAVALLRRRGLPVSARIVGDGERARFEAQARSAGVGEHVHFAGIVPNAEIPALMRDSAAVLVPSHHRYPEGFPLTLYEALYARTPIVASDHPMFRGHMIDRETAMIHRQRDPASLADAVAALLSDPALYRRLSEAAPACWDRLQIETKWADLLHHWLDDDRDWFARRAIAAPLG